MYTKLTMLYHKDDMDKYTDECEIMVTQVRVLTHRN